MRAFRATALLLLATATVLSCTDDPAAEVDWSTVDVGETVTLRFEATDTALHLVFRGVADSAYAATVVPLEGGVFINAFDFISGAPISTTTLISTYDSGLELTAPLFRVPTTGNYVIRVHRAGGSPTSSLELALHAVHVAPEQTSSTVAIGTPVIGEDIADASDLDRFTFTGVAGSWIEPELLVGGTIDPTRTACLTLTGPDGTWLQSTAAFPGDSALFDPQGGRIQLPSSGSYRVEVASARNRCVGFTNYSFTGSYDFTLHPIDPLPENAPATINNGDTITTEAIDRVGDFDRFVVKGAPGSYTMIYAQRTWTGPRGLMRFRVWGHDSYFGADTDTALTSSPVDVYSIPDPAGLTIEISGWKDGPGGDSGSYRLFFDPIDPAPETHTAAISIGDTVSDESIEKLGDLDRFTFKGTVGQLVKISFRVLAGPATGGLRLWVWAPDGSLVGDGYVLYNSPGLPDAFTTTFPITTTGPYTVEVASAHNHHHDNVGNYRFEVQAIDPAP